MTTPSKTPGSLQGQPVAQSSSPLDVWVWTRDGEYAVGKAQVYLMTKDGKRELLGMTDSNGFLRTSLRSGDTTVFADSPVYSRDGVSWYYSGSFVAPVKGGVGMVIEMRLSQKQVIHPPPTPPV